MDSLPEIDIIFQAVKDSVFVVKVNFMDWTLDDLMQTIRDSVGDPDHQLSSVGILNHGDPGKFGLLKSVNGGAITRECIQDSDDVKQFFKFLAQYVAQDDQHRGYDDPRYRIDLLCCSVAQGPEGEQLIQTMEELTGVNCAGSENKIGHELMGGNWWLETEPHLGSVDACYFHPDKMQEWVQVCGWGSWVAAGAFIGAVCVAGPVALAGAAVVCAEAVVTAEAVSASAVVVGAAEAVCTAEVVASTTQAAMGGAVAGSSLYTGYTNNYKK